MYRFASLGDARFQDVSYVSRDDEAVDCAARDRDGAGGPRAYHREMTACAFRARVAAAAPLPAPPPPSFADADADGSSLRLKCDARDERLLRALLMFEFQAALRARMRQAGLADDYVQTAAWTAACHKRVPTEALSVAADAGDDGDGRPTLGRAYAMDVVCVVVRPSRAHGFLLRCRCTYDVATGAFALHEVEVKGRVDEATALSTVAAAHRPAFGDESVMLLH